jgi:hypothetical protein
MSSEAYQRHMEERDSNLVNWQANEENRDLSSHENQSDQESVNSDDFQNLGRIIEEAEEQL